MDYQYIGYNEDKKLVRGTVAAVSQEVAAEVLAHQGYQVLSLKTVAAFMPTWDKLFPSLFRVKPRCIPVTVGFVAADLSHHIVYIIQLSS